MQRGCRRFEVAIFSKAWCGEFRLFFSNIFTCCASWDGGTWKKEIYIGKKKKKKRFLWPQWGKQTAKTDKESASRSRWRRRRWSQRRNWPQWNQRFACESECFRLKTSQFFVFEFWRARRYPDPKEVDKRWTQSRISRSQVASGFKLQDATLLSEGIASAAICSSCRKPQSTLKLYQRDYQREGLAECLFLKCSICNHETDLKTSKKLGGVGGGAHEVNRRSVLASQKLGQAGLTDFCARMNLPPPVTNKSFNEHLIQIGKKWKGITVNYIHSSCLKF